MNRYSLAFHVQAYYPRLWDAAGNEVPGHYSNLDAANFMAEKIGFRKIPPCEAIENILKEMEKHLGGMGE